MNDEETKEDNVKKSEHKPYRIHLPGFVADKDIGLGDVIKHVTFAVGIKPCGGCERRAAWLNSWFVFTGWHSK